MSDRAAVVVAVAAVVGAYVGRGPAAWVGVALVVAALAIRRPVALVLAVCVLTGSRASAAEAGLVAASTRTGPVHGWLSVLTDAEPFGSGLRADMRLPDGRHVQAEARSTVVVERFRSLHAGQEVLVSGSVERPPPGASWLRVRHVSGVLTVRAIERVRAGPPWMQAANGVRDLLARGADALPGRQRSLFLGFVLGDTRDQPVDITDDFRGAGLSHLLAVSGQNVAFVLALAGPALRRVSLRARLPSTLAVIAFFALVTRFEPSVLRASAMAALAVTAATLGREASSLRVLALSVAGLVVADPFLVDSVGFRLSVAACVGIVVLAPRLARVLPGPRRVADALSVTLAAQVGVAPVLISVFDGVPVVGVPANLLAGPVAGPVMVWGLGAGLVAGMCGGPFAALLHLPTRVMIGWIAFVAHRASLTPFGEIGSRELVVLAAAGLTAGVAHTIGFVGLRRVAAALVLTATVAPGLVLRRPGPVHTAVGDGAVLWRDGAVVLDIDGRVGGADLLEALRRAGVTRIDLLVVRVDGSATRAAVDSLKHRYSIGSVIAPDDVSASRSVRAGHVLVDLRRAGTRLIVDIRRVLDGREGAASRPIRGRAPPV